MWKDQKMKYSLWMTLRMMRWTGILKISWHWNRRKKETQNSTPNIIHQDRVSVIQGVMSCVIELIYSFFLKLGGRIKCWEQPMFQHYERTHINDPLQHAFVRWSKEPSFNQTMMMISTPHRMIRGRCKQIEKRNVRNTVCDTGSNGRMT